MTTQQTIDQNTKAMRAELILSDERAIMHIHNALVWIAKFEYYISLMGGEFSWQRRDIAEYRNDIKIEKGKITRAVNWLMTSL